MTYPTDEQRAEFADWVTTRPPAVREVAAKFTPWSWWRIKGDEGLWAYKPIGYFEDGTLRCLKFSVATGEPIIQVFGMPPDQMEAVDSPEVQRERLTPEQTMIGAVAADFHTALIDARVQELEENPDAPPLSVPDEVPEDAEEFIRWLYEQIVPDLEFHVDEENGQVFFTDPDKEPN